MKSLGTRIALMLAAILFALMLAAGMLIERQLSQAIYNEEVDQAKLHAQTLLASLQTLMLNGQGTLARSWLNSMHGTAGIVDIGVLRLDGSEAFTDLDTVMRVNGFIDSAIFERDPALPKHIPLAMQGAFVDALNGVVALDLRYPEEITVLQPINADSECMACHGYDPGPLRGVLKLSLSRAKGIERIDAMRYNLWGIAVFLTAFLALLVMGMLRFGVLNPINKMRDAIARVGEGVRDVRLPVKWRDELGQVARVFNQMQHELASNEARIRAVADNVFDSIITTDDQGVIETVNQATQKMFGYSVEQMLGSNVAMLMPEAYREDHAGYIERYLVTGKGRTINSRVELVGCRRDNSTFPMELALSEMFIGDKRYFVAVARDITESKQQTAALEYQALHDALTELPNRALLSDRIHQSILIAQRNQHSLALLVMDLNRFKDINDTLGHKYGDVVLQQVGRRMRDILRESDTIARLGGDEFAVLLGHADLDQAKKIAGKLLEAIEQPIQVESQTLHVGGSIGITLYPQHGEDEMMLLQRADVAMSVAKRGHTGYAVYDPRKDQHSLRNLALLGDLRGGIERDELALWFQPKVCLKTGRVCSLEALVRWHHPVHGLMPPDEFIPLAEQSGLIGLLSLWVLKHALLCYKTINAQGVDVDVAINLSVRNLQDKGFAANVMQQVKNAGVPPQRLRIEMTETAIMSDPGRALAVLNEFSALGLRLSIDDFGTGYSSLAHLKQMPVDELKIDKNFVIGMAEDENDAVIVRSIIDLAHNIGIQVVAEGVETEEVYAMLESLGCDVVQGRLINAPLPSEELLPWLRNSKWW